MLFSMVAEADKSKVGWQLKRLAQVVPAHRQSALGQTFNN
jgi:hypothetical protein